MNEDVIKNMNEDVIINTENIETIIINKIRSLTPNFKHHFINIYIRQNYNIKQINY